MNRVSMVLACAAMLFAVQPAAASEEVSSSELAEMRELVNELKQKVDAQEEQIEHQGQLLEQAQDVARRHQEEGTQSGLSTFLDSIDVGGHISASYNYNLKRPQNRQAPDNGPFDDINGGYGANAGVDGAFLPFHQDHNTMTVDQIVFNIMKPATEESRAGFGFEILLGQNANFLGQGGQINNNGDLQSRRSHNLDGTSDYYISQAYIEYQCGCLGPEITLTAGKFMTVVGAEVFQSPANFNITRGNVYSLLQPVDHLGLTASSDLGPVNFTLGIVNSGGSSISAPDLNNEKSYLASALVGNDEMNVRASFVYGAEGYPSSTTDLDSTRSGLVDVTAWFNPTESISTWANYNYLYLEGSGLYAHGVAVAGRVQLLEKLGVALRGEYIRQHPANSIPGQESFFSLVADDNPDEVYSATLTFDYKVTDHLTTRVEGRWDYISERIAGQGFFEDQNGFDDNQAVALAEILYEF